MINTKKVGSTNETIAVNGKWWFYFNPMLYCTKD